MSKYEYGTMKESEWFNLNRSKFDKINIKKWGWDKRKSLVLLRLNLKTNKLNPVKYGFKTHKAAFDYLAKNKREKKLNII